MVVSKIWKDFTFTYYLHCLVSHLGNGSEIHLSDDFCMECAPTESIIFLRAKKLVRNCCGGHL